MLTLHSIVRLSLRQIISDSWMYGINFQFNCGDFGKMEDPIQKEPAER